MIPPFTLASDPTVQIQLRDATVADAMDFADVDDSHEEELTTLFLRKMQEGTIWDPRKWTAEDRCLALFWHWLHTTTDHDIALSYDCLYCGEKHIYLQDFRVLGDHYTALNGSPLRKGQWKDENIVVHPLTGWDMEDLERKRLMFELAPGGLEHKKAKAAMTLEYFTMSVIFEDRTDKTPRDREKIKGRTRDKILAMFLDDFSVFAEMVSGLLSEMKHGLDMEYDEGRCYLIMPPHECPGGGGKTRVRYPFWNINYIPGL
jgi:hypothetical protein